MIAVARVHKALPAHGPETDFETQIQQQKKKNKKYRVDKLFPIRRPETNYFLRMA